MKKIDVSSWERASHYEWFSKFANPCFSLGVRMDITQTLKYAKEHNVSSFALIMYVICKAVNNNKAFRLRVLNNEVVEIDYANVAYTVMVNDSRFVNCRANPNTPLETFLAEVKSNHDRFQNSNYVQEKYNNTAIVDDIYCSCVPWTDFICASQPIPDHLLESNCIPRICWGKYSKEGKKTKLSVYMTANHALVDGIDMSNVLTEIQESFDSIEKII